MPAVLRIAAGAFTLGSLLLVPWPLFPLAWVAVLRPPGAKDGSPGLTARVLLAALAVMESLQVYPVGGTQKWIAALVLVPVGAIIFNDGLRQFQGWAAGQPNRAVGMVADWLAPAALIVNIPFALLFVYVAGSAYASGQSLGLRGTDLIKLPPTQASELRSLAQAIDQNCGEMITMPRMSSLSLWTGREGFSALNPGLWQLTLDSSGQRAIVDKIRDQPRICVVRNQFVLDWEAQGRPIARRPLVEFINTEFVPAATFGDYELLIRKSQ
jgi:hypothetical protein